MKIKTVLVTLFFSYFLIATPVITGAYMVEPEAAAPDPEAAPEPTMTEAAAPETIYESPTPEKDPKYEPKIYLIPHILSFPKTDWKLVHGRPIKIAVYNPQKCHITHASIKLRIPSGWEFYPDTNNSIVNFDPDKSLFWIHNFGNYTHNGIESWFTIKPGPSISEGRYELLANSLIFFRNENMDIDYSRNFSTFIYLNVVDDTKEPESNPFKGNIYIFIIISTACALVALALKFRQK